MGRSITNIFEQVCVDSQQNIRLTGHTKAFAQLLHLNLPAILPEMAQARSVLDFIIKIVTINSKFSSMLLNDIDLFQK